MVTPKNEPEFNRPVSIEQIDRREGVWTETASTDECVFVAERLKIPAVRSLSVEAECTLLDGGRFVRIKGEVKADVTLTCSLSLEEFDTSYAESFDLRLAVEGKVKPEREIIPPEELDVDEATDLFPDFTDGQYVNLGEIAVEALSLAIPDYPRAPDAELPAGVQAEEEGKKQAEEENTHRPFAKLAILKDHKPDAE